MRSHKFLVLIIIGILCFPFTGQTLEAPLLQVSINGSQVDISWNKVSNALGHKLYYAAFPYTGSGSIQSFDLADSNSLSVQLSTGAAFYITIVSYDNTGESAYSNIELVQINSSSKDLPSGIIMKSVTGGTFAMGNNSLLGPQSKDATEHQVTLSDFELSETEITNSQYIEFLNAAFSDGLIEVQTGSSGPDLGKSLVVGTSTSGYAGLVLYELSGTRVMKDHDDADGDNDPFTGKIEPENPLNIAFIGFDSAQQLFSLKDPHNAADFNWQELTNYYDYGTTSHVKDTNQQFNDFSSWDELKGWTESDPSAATGLPAKNQGTDYPVTFIRWWGAKAFALYYDVKLPTEAQWEYAAKAGSQNYFYAVYDGISVDDANWNNLKLNPAIHHVRAAKSGQPNPFGLYNLAGNVWEWMADNYQAFTSDPAVDPLVEVSGSTTRSWRGGSWNYHQATLESSARYYDDEDKGNDHFGFRIAK